MTLNLRRGFNRIFAILAGGWGLFCLFVYPVLMAREAKTHYDSDLKSCNEIYGPAGKSPESGALERCLSTSRQEFRAGTYSGFGFAWDAGEFWSFKGYYRHMAWLLLAMIILPPLLMYLLAWGITALGPWIGRGFVSMPGGRGPGTA